jgi:hypothetical protein
MLLSFPYMHPELFHAEPVPGLKFFDPGLHDDMGESAFRPKDLPMNSQTATALIRDCISFGEQFKDPGEMAYFGAQTAEDFYEGSSLSIQSQLSQRFAEGQVGKEERERGEALSQAQFVLLLACFFEEHIIELQKLEEGVKDSWKSIDSTLGLADEDRIEERVLDLGCVESHTGGVSDGQTIRFPWQRVVEALPAFISDDTVLVCSDTEVIAQWDDLELPFSSADKVLGLPDGTQVVTQPAWKLSGRRKAPEDFPFASCELTIAVIR